MKVGIHAYWELAVWPGPLAHHHVRLRPPKAWHWDRITTALLLALGTTGALWSCTGPVG